MCRYMEEHLNRILLTWLQRWNSKLWRTASTKLIPYSSLMRQTQLRLLVSLKKLCVTTGFMEDIFQMISNLLLPAIHIESKWCRLIRFVPCSHNYQPTLRLLVADTQQRWFKNLSRLGLVFLSKQLKPRKELVCIILVIKHLYSCINLLLLRDYVLRENSTQTACVQSARFATKYEAPSIWLWTAPTSKRSRLYTQNCSQLCKMRMQIVDWSTQTYLIT